MSIELPSEVIKSLVLNTIASGIMPDDDDNLRLIYKSYIHSPSVHIAGIDDKDYISLVGYSDDSCIGSFVLYLTRDYDGTILSGRLNIANPY